MKKLRIMRTLLRQTGASKLIWGFFIFTIISAFIIWIFDPTIKRFPDSLWYCYSVVTTCGFGDVVTETLISRIMSVILSVYAVIVIAIITGILVAFYKEIMSRRNENTLSAFMDKLEDMPNLSHEELVQLSERVKAFRMRGK